jgi:hypothetical protein
MENLFLNYEQALALRQLGFDDDCFAYHNMVNHSGEFKIDVRIWENCDAYIEAPLKQQAFNFFREKFDLDYEITYAGKKGEYHAFVNTYVYGNNGISPSIFSYTEAESVCIDNLIKFAKNNVK